MPIYNSKDTEVKWQKKWKESGIYKTDLKTSKKPKYYNLVMFPYPSGDKLHIGHWYNYGPADSWGRYIRMKGFNVFEPFGFDSFGLPAENYAIKTGLPPRVTTEKNIEYMREQLGRIGTMYDWDKEVVTSHPDYYKWTQWCFLKMYEKGLAYRKKAAVNWCPSCQTVLANEQVQEGVCERCKTVVTKKDLTQWFFNIKKYAEELLDFNGLDWPESTKMMEEDWIGKSIGAEVDFKVVDSSGAATGDKITVFTTRVDTLFSGAYVVLAPEHELVRKLLTKEQAVEVEKYISATKQITDIERTSLVREKTGVFLGSYVVNPINNEKIPVWISDFVLVHYGTGAVFADAHDERDFAFGKKYGLKMRTTIKPADDSLGFDDAKIRALEECFTGDGILYDSAEFTGMSSEEARKAITWKLAQMGQGRAVISYKLRDWLISRQRYWGAPIPMIICEKCGDVPVPVSALPVILPEEDVDYKPRGKSPLASVSEFLNTKCPKCGGEATREVDTMDTFVDSSWYFLRYLNANDTANAYNAEMNKKWMPVDMYIGGPEHACMHLLYARFVHKVLVDDVKSEPFKRLVHQGLITKDGAKMSKSKGNVVSPDEFVEKYGSDVFRMYLMFMGPFTEGGDWNDKGITGIARFVENFYLLVGTAGEALAKSGAEASPKGEPRSGEPIINYDIAAQKNLHKTIKKVTEDIEKMQFNTAIAALMEFTNNAKKTGLNTEAKKIAAQLIAPLAPHLAEELWETLGEKFTIFDSEWPKYDAKLLEEANITLPIQVNGKLRGQIEIAKNASKEDVISAAKLEANVVKHLEGKKIVKEILVPGRLVNFVVE